MKNNSSHSEKLLRRWLDGSITAREEAELDRAAQGDPWLAEALAGYRQHAGAEHVEALERLREQLPVGARRSRLVPMLWRIAAVGLVVLVAAWWIWDSSLTNTDAASLATETVRPTEETQAEGMVAAAERTVPEPAPTASIPADVPTAVDTEDSYLAEASPVQSATERRRSADESAGFGVNKEVDILADQSIPATAGTVNSSTEVVTELEFEVAEEEAVAVGAAPLPSPAPPAVTEAVEEIASDDTPAPSWQAAPPQSVRTIDPSRATNMGRMEASPGYFLVSGKVSDQDGYPLIGVNILEVGSNRGVVTDVDGAFQLAIDTTTRELQLSYTGFSTQVVTVTPQAPRIEVVLDEAAEALSEVIITKRSKARDAADVALPVVRPQVGYRAFRRYVRENTPSGTPRGRVRLSFRINGDGSVTGIQVLNGPSDRLADLAIDLLAQGPRWEIQAGEAPVDVEYVIRFK